MASYEAIAATSEAIVRLLRTNFVPANFSNPQLDFSVFVADDFRNEGMPQGVSLFLYRVYVNTASGSPLRRVLPTGEKLRPTLPVDLHFLLTAWATKASLQHEITGWMMRVIEDNPILPPALLNSYKPAVFRPDEAVELAAAQLSVEDLFRIWDVMIPHDYQLSVPYIARQISIDSMLSDRIPALIQERVDEFQKVG